MTLITILEASSREHYRQAKTLFQEYASSLSFALDFQDFNTELETLPTIYGAPRGVLLLAQDSISARYVGCVGVRGLSADSAELKRMFVAPDYRRHGVGARLLESSIKAARANNYKAIRLDSSASMQSAIRLYRAYGFEQIPAYCYNPLPDALYFELKLIRAGHPIHTES